VADREYAGMQPVQARAGDAMTNRGAAEPELEQLLARHDAVLTTRQRRDVAVHGTRWHFRTHAMPNCPLVRHAPMVATRA
jgi:hypothetical protein